MDDITLPSYYVVARTLTHTQEYAVRQVLSITPILGAIVFNAMDMEVARKFSEHLFSVNTAAEAHSMAKTVAEDMREPVLIVGDTGDANILDAYYPDGTKEKIV